MILGFFCLFVCLLGCLIDVFAKGFVFGDLWTIITSFANCKSPAK